MVTCGAVISVLNSALEMAAILMEYVAPVISPVIMTLVSVPPAVSESLCPPSSCW